MASPGSGIPRPVVELQAMYRQLRSRGLGTNEAANLTAWLTGIPVRDHRWEIRQVQTLLFLRTLSERGRFGPSDGTPH